MARDVHGFEARVAAGPDGVPVATALRALAATDHPWRAARLS
jgi:hypothetical protein